MLSSWSSFIPSQQFHLCIQTKLQCETPLLRLTEDWRSRDSKETVTIASKDLSKAFDSIPHALLLARLKANDLSEMSIELLRSYLSATIPHLKLETRFLNGNWWEEESPREVSFVPYFSMFTSMIYSTILSRQTWMSMPMINSCTCLTRT